MGTCFYFQQGILETEQKGCMTMCGIVGYIGTEQAAPIILDGLSKLEYRGYDSAGMAIFDGEKINTRKAVGRLKVLENLTHGGENMKGTSGIGHTRWATHGAPSDINSHPHQLRHYFAEERRKEGWDLNDIRFALGHKKVETTIKYLGENNERLIEATDQYYSNNENLYQIADFL